MLERADDVWREHRAWGGVKDIVPEPPSTYYYRQVYGCFFRDRHGLESLERVGVDNITFETDYPHTDSTWPDTKAGRRGPDGPPPRRRRLQDRARQRDPHAEPRPRALNTRLASTLEPVSGRFEVDEVALHRVVDTVAAAVERGVALTLEDDERAPTRVGPRALRPNATGSQGRSTCPARRSAAHPRHGTGAGSADRRNRPHRARRRQPRGRRTERRRGLGDACRDLAGSSSARRCGRVEASDARRTRLRVWFVVLAARLAVGVLVAEAEEGRSRHRAVSRQRVGEDVPPVRSLRTARSATPRSASPGPSSRVLAVDLARHRLGVDLGHEAVVGALRIGATEAAVVGGAQSSRKARRALSKPSACSRVYCSYGNEGSTAPSSTSARDVLRVTVGVLRTEVGAVREAEVRQLLLAERCRVSRPCRRRLRSTKGSPADRRCASRSRLQSCAPPRGSPAPLVSSSGDLSVAKK